MQSCRAPITAAAALPLACRHVTGASGIAWKEGQLDFTGAQMVLTLRLIAVAVRWGHQAVAGGCVCGTPPSVQPLTCRRAFPPLALPNSYQDGARPAKAASAYAAKKRLAALPSPLLYLSYLFAAGNLLAGPFFEASDFFDYVERKVKGGGDGRW